VNPCHEQEEIVIFPKGGGGYAGMSRDGPLVYRLDVLSCMVAVSAVASGNGQGDHGRIGPRLLQRREVIRTPDHGPVGHDAQALPATDFSAYI